MKRAFWQTSAPQRCSAWSMMFFTSVSCPSVMPVPCDCSTGTTTFPLAPSFDSRAFSSSICRIGFTCTARPTARISANSTTEMLNLLFIKYYHIFLDSRHKCDAKERINSSFMHFVDVLKNHHFYWVRAAGSPEQGLLIGQFPLSSWVQLTALPVIHSSMESARECSVPAGILKLALVKSVEVLQTWLEQDGDQYPLSLRSAMRWRVADVLAWYCSMQARSPASQSASDPLLWHPIPMMQCTDHESQADSIANSGTLMYAERCSANMHFHFSLGLAATHSEVGGSISSFDTFMKFSNSMRQVFCFKVQCAESRKMPESGSDHTLAVFGARSAIQLVQRKVASPPADCPVTTISVAVLKSWWAWSMELSCARVTLWPRKCRLDPLQLTGSFLQPWCPVPSQYLRCATVQSLKQFCATSLRMPCEKAMVSGQEEELPSAVPARPRQLARVWSRPAQLPHHPPPSKLSRNLLASLPSAMQQAPLLPSRHSAPGSPTTTFRSVRDDRAMHARATSRASLREWLRIRYVQQRIQADQWPPLLTGRSKQSSLQRCPLQKYSRTNNRKRLHCPLPSLNNYIYLVELMSQLTASQINALLQEKKLNNEQLTALQSAVQAYAGKASKQEVIATFRRLAWMPSLLESDLSNRFGQKKEKPIRISYDLFPSGRVENFEVQEVDE